jgi:hypothetical protein
VLSVPALAAPTVTATPSQTVNASGNRVWTVQVVPDGGGAVPSSLAIELGFTHFAGSSSLTMGIVDNAAIDVNTGNAGAANDTWYYNETTAGSGTILWNTSDPPNVADLTQNVGDSPFIAGPDATEGLVTGGVNAFAALGSTIINTASGVNTLQVVTQGAGGILRMSAGIVGQKNVGDTNATNYAIAAKDFYVPGDYDGNGIVGPPDLSLLLFAFNQHYTTQPTWDGALPVAASGIVGPPDLSNLLFNFNAGFSSGAGSAVGGNQVPEPTSAMLLAFVGMAGLAFRRRR